MPAEKRAGATIVERPAVEASVPPRSSRRHDRLAVRRGVTTSATLARRALSRRGRRDRAQTLTPAARLVNGCRRARPGQADLHPSAASPTAGGKRDGPLGPLEYVARSRTATSSLDGRDDQGADGSHDRLLPGVTGDDLLSPGGTPTFKGVRSDRLVDKLDFISLMLALFCGTASLPHILIRYYTVKDAAAARKSTVVGIASIGFFYVLTLFLGPGRDDQRRAST